MHVSIIGGRGQQVGSLIQESEMELLSSYCLNCVLPIAPIGFQVCLKNSLVVNWHKVWNRL